MRALVTRPQPGADATARSLRAVGIEPVVAPLLAVRWLAPALPDHGDIDAIALTSANGLRGLMALAGAAALLPVPVFAVGEQTARAARTAGFTSVSSADGGLAELVELISASLVHGTVLYPRAQEVAGDLAAALRGDGIGVADAVVYDMVATEALERTAAELLSGEVGLVLVYSQRTAERFARLAEALPSVLRRRLTVLCLSGQVAAAVEAGGFGDIRIASAPNEAAVLALASSFAGRENPA